MSSKNPGPRKSKKGKSRDDLLKESGAIREKEVALLGKISEMGIDDKEIKALHDEVSSLRVELHDKDDKLRVQNEKLRVQTEELEAQLEELRSTSEELEKANADLKVQVRERNHVEEALRRSEEKYRELVESANSIIIRWDMNGNFTFFNEFAEKFFGFSQKEVIGKNVMGTIVPATETTGRDLAAMIEDIKQYPERYKSNVNENVRKNGERVWISWTNKAVLDAHGEMIGILAVGNDITSQKRVEEVHSQLASIVESSSDAIISKTLDGIITSWNKGAELVYGYGSDEVIGKPISILAPRDHPDEIPHILEKIRQGEGIVYHDTKRVRKDGKLIDVSLTVSPIKDMAGRIIGAATIARNINESKKVEEALRKSEAELLRAQQISHIGSWAWDLITDELTWSDESYRNYGLVPGEVKPTYELFLSFIVPEDRGMVDKAVRKAIDTGEKYNVIYNIIRKDGTPRILLSENEIITDGSGKIVKMYGTNQDITERKRVEDALRESQVLLRAVTEGSPDPIFVKDLQSRIMLANPATLQIWGKSLEDVVGKNDRELYADPAIGEAIIVNDRRVMESGRSQVIEEVVQTQDGYRTYLSTKTPYYNRNGEIVGILGIARDITDRKRSEEALRETSNYLDSLINYANAPIIVWDPDFKITRFNRAFERLTGYVSGDMVGRKLDILFPADSKEKSLVRIKRTLDGEYMESVEVPILRKDGGTRIALWNSANIYGMDSKTLVATIAQGQDITERKRIEETVRETSNYLDSLINYANAPIIVWDPDFKITRFNHAFERMTGYIADEMVDRELDILFPSDSREKSIVQIKRTLAGEFMESVEVPILRKDGDIRIALWNSANIYDKDGTTVVATIAQGQDISERKRAEDELSEAKNQAELYLDLMGHDISNMHQIIMGQLELAKEVMDTDCKLEAVDRELIDTSLETLERSARLIDNVRNLQKLRSGEFNEEVLDMDELISGIIREYENLLPNGSIKFFREGRHPVKANKLLHDVFSNLVGNAIKHSNGSEVDITVKIEDVQDDARNFHKVSIEDNGPGIPDDMKDKIFNRLQRGETKARGMGLGLYLVKSLVDSYNGKVWVEDRISGDHTKGSRFVVVLPAALE